MFPPRTQVYEGLYPSQIRERFEADAREAAEYDWYPVNEAWRGPDLHVTYAHDPWRKQAQAGVATRDAAAAHRRGFRGRLLHR
ncbi:MAG: hypothetical protein R3C32_01605 [Chloroflexota bacterium]